MRLKAFLTLIICILPVGRLSAQDDTKEIELYKPASYIKVDPSHLIFNYAQGIMVGYESELTKNLNWSLELGRAIRNNTPGQVLNFQSGSKAKFHVKKYMAHVGKKRTHTRYLGVGIFYDHHVITERGHPELNDPFPSIAYYRVERSAVGLEIVNGVVIPFDENVFLEAYGVLRSSLTTRDHGTAPDVFRTTSGGWHGDKLREEGSSWRYFHIMVGVKFSYVISW